MKEKEKSIEEIFKEAKKRIRKEKKELKDGRETS